MELRLRRIEEELNYLRKIIESQNEIIKNLKCENHTHLHYETQNLFVKDDDEEVTGDNFPPNIY